MSTKQELVKTFSKGIIPPFAMTALFFFCCWPSLISAGPWWFLADPVLHVLIGGTRFIYLFMAIGVGLGWRP